MAAPQTLVFIQKSAGRGGAKNRLLDTLTTLQAGTDCKLHVVSGESGEFTERCIDRNVPVTIHPLPEWRKLWSRLAFPSAIQSLAQKLPFDHADWVVSNEMWWAPHAAALAKKLGAKSATIIRDGIADVAKGRKYRLQDNTRILPSSIKIARNLAKDPELAKRTCVFLDAVFLPASIPESQASLERQLATAPPVVKRWLLVLGRVQERKNQADAIRVLKGLLDRGHKDLGLLVAGDCDSEYRPVMDEVMRKCEVQERVVMLGNFPDIQALFSKAALSILTSYREALPGSMMESCLSGLPCFMYPCEGAEDIFGPHEPLFVSSDFRPELLIEKIDGLLRDPMRLASEAAALQIRAQGLFSQEAHLRELAEKLSIHTR